MIFRSLITPEGKSPMRTITIGIDLAKSVFAACELDGGGRVSQRRELRRGPFAQWLAQEGIASISLNPDSVIETWQRLAG